MCSGISENYVYSANYLQDYIHLCSQEKVIQRSKHNKKGCILKLPNHFIPSQTKVTPDLLSPPTQRQISPPRNTLRKAHSPTSWIFLSLASSGRSMWQVARGGVNEQQNGASRRRRPLPAIRGLLRTRLMRRWASVGGSGGAATRTCAPTPGAVWGGRFLRRCIGMLYVYRLSNRFWKLSFVFVVFFKW